MTRDDAIAEITRKLVDFYRPVRIYLFGSVARGDDGPDSDLDFLVVVPDDLPEDRLRPGAGRRAVRGTGLAKDIISLAANRLRATRGMGKDVAAGYGAARRKTAL